MSDKYNKLLLRLANYEKLAFHKKADISDVFKLLNSSQYETTSELLEDIANAQLYLLTNGEELDFLNKEDNLYKSAEKYPI